MRLFLLLLTGIAFLSLAGRALAQTPSPVILPRPQIPLAFSHTKHLKLGMKCLSCHGGATKSIDSADSLLPKEQICTTCHNIKAKNPAKVFPKATCDTCHPDFVQGQDREPAKVVLPPPRLRMTHRAHAILGIVCGDCHRNMEKQSGPSRNGWGERIPTMATCIDCHNGAAAPAACTTCHLAEDDGRLITRFGNDEPKLAPIGRYRDDDHRDPNWKFRHAFPARDQAYCYSCHATSDCLDCHAGAEKPSAIHPGNYVLLHSRDALTQSDQCVGCHEGGVGCQKCHETVGVSEASSVSQGALTTRRIHPEGWASFTLGENHHAQSARNSMNTCVTCHSEQECIRCHSTRTLRVNPHPPGFTGKNLKGRAGDMCEKCHDDL